jgi:hypothetical protein
MVKGKRNLKAIFSEAIVNKLVVFRIETPNTFLYDMVSVKILRHHNNVILTKLDC